MGRRSGALPLLVAVGVALIVGLVAWLTALLLFLLLPLFVLLLLPLTLRPLTLAELSLVFFVTHIEFSFTHRIYRPIEMHVRWAVVRSEETISRAAGQLLCIQCSMPTKNAVQGTVILRKLNFLL